MNAVFSVRANRKRLALSGIAAAAAFLATNPQPTRAQGVYSFTIDPVQTVSVSTVLSAAGSHTYTVSSAMSSLSMVGLNTKYSVTAITIENGAEYVYMTQTMNGASSAGVNFSATMNLFYDTSPSATAALVAQQAVNVNPVRAANDTYVLTDVISPVVTLTSASAISAYVTEGSTGNHAAVLNNYNVVDTMDCVSLAGSACDGSSATNYQPYIYISYYLAAVPGPSSAAVFLPGMSAGLLLLRRRKRLGATGCLGPPSRK